MKRMKRMVSLLIGAVMCMGIALPYITVENKVQAADAVTYVVNLPEGKAITNVEGAEGSMQFIDIDFNDEALGKALLNFSYVKDAVTGKTVATSAVTVRDAEGNKVNITYFATKDTVKVPLANFSSNETYTISVTPKGYDAYEGTFTTGEIVDDTNVAAGLEVQKKLTYSFVDLQRGYDLDSVSIVTENSVGAKVYLTRDLQEDFDDMTLLGTISEATQSFEITGYDIAKYQYIIVKGNETVKEIKGFVSSDSMKGVKARPVGGDNVDIRFSSWADLHLRQGQRDVTNMTDILTKSKSEKFGGHLDAMILVGDINCITDSSDGKNSYQDAMLNQYSRIENMMAENGYGYSNLNNDTDDIIPVIFAAGNHEYQHKVNNDTHKSWFINEVDDFNSHKVINGYHFIAGSTNYDAVMEEDTTAWMKAEIEKAMAEDPTGTKPIFVFGHTQAVRNVGYSTSNPTYDPYYAGKSAEFVDWMKDYPQIVYFSGHTHYAMQQQTTIVQVGFTQIVLGLAGGSNIGGPGNTTDTGFVRDNIDDLEGDLSYHPQGAIIEAKNNVVYVYKIDFRNGGQIGDPWIIDTEGLSEGTSRAYYTNERHQFSVAPEFPEGAEENIVVNYTTTEKTATTGDVITTKDATITFPQAQCNGIYGDKYPLVYHLKIYDQETGILCNTYSHYSDAIYWSDKYTLTPTYTLDVPTLQMGRKYTVEIVARNSFNKFGTPIVTELDYTVSGQGAEGAEIPTATILNNNYYETEADKYKFFTNAATADKVTMAETKSAPYSLEATFNTVIKNAGRLVGTDAHNLSITSNDSTYYITYTYTVDGVAKTLTTSSYYKNTIVDVVGVCDGASAKLYVDGVLVKAETITGVVDSISGDITIGKSVFSSIMKARAYNCALSSEQVIALNEESNQVKPTGEDAWVRLLSPEEIRLAGGTVHLYSLSNIMDGDNSTSVQISGATPRTVVIDLGKAYDVKAVSFRSSYLDVNGNQKIKLERSETDTEERTLIYSTAESGELTKNTSYYYSINDDMRYMYLSTAYSGQLFVINEVRVFGKPITP